MTDNEKKPESPITKAYRRLRGQDFPLVVRVIDRHLVVTSPDFRFPIPIVVPYDPPTVEQGGKALIAAFLQISDYLKTLENSDESPPVPSKTHSLFPKLVDEISLAEACRILGMKPDMVRELADEGKIPSSRTPKGHRRFSREKLQAFIKNYLEENANRTR